jgi:competence protein CoiA
MIYATSFDKKCAAQPGGQAFCPECGKPVIAKCGEINIWHWAHVAKSDCDIWSEGETDWHLGWKNNFPIDCAEKIVSKNGITHRADVMTKAGWVIEFQYSPLNPEEIRERESFYGNMCWVFNAIEPYLNDRLYFWHTVSMGDRFRWKHPNKSIFYPERRIYLDIGDGRLFLTQHNWLDTTPPYRGSGKFMKKDEFVKYYNQH